MQRLRCFHEFPLIALIPVFMKIMNLLVKELPLEFIETNQILPQSTYAYRKHRSSSICKNDLLYTINHLKEKGEKRL